MFVSEICVFSIQNPNISILDVQLVSKHLHYSFFTDTPFQKKKKKPTKAITKKTAEGEGMHISSNFQALQYLLGWRQSS